MTNSSTILSRSTWLGLAALGAILMGLTGIWYFYPSPSATPIAAQLEQIGGDYRQKLQDMHQRYQVSCAQVGREDFAAARRNIAPAVVQLNSWSTTLFLLQKFVTDQLLQQQQVAEYLQQVWLPKLTAPSRHGEQKLIALRRQWDYDLTIWRNQLQMELARVWPESRPPIWSGPNSTAMWQAQVQAAGGQLNAAQVSAAFNVLLESVLLKSSLHSLKKLFLPLVARLTARLSSSMLCAAADGPLPFGDVVSGILTTGGLGYTIYDLYQVRQILPQELTQDLLRALDQCENTARGNLQFSLERETNFALTELDKILNHLKLELITP